MIKKTTIVLSVGILAGCLLGISRASALTLIPPSLEFGVNPGEISETSVKVYNETAETLELYTEVTNFTASGETGQPAFDFEAPLAGLASWIEVEAGPISVEPGERQEIPVTVNVPLEADPGGHYAAIFFVDEPPEVGAGQVKVASKLGTLLLAKVAGDIEEAGSLVEFLSGDNQTTFARLPIEFFARFQNSGNVHLRPTGTITITNLFGGESGVIDINAAEGATLPDTIRKYEAIWEKAQVEEANGNAWNNFWTEFGNERKNFGLGRYKATLNLTYGAASDMTASSELTFWVWPWRVIVISALLLFVVIWLLIWLIKRYNAWLVKKAQK